MLPVNTEHTVTLYAPEEAGCGFEYEQRLYCRALDMLKLCSSGWVCSRALPLQYVKAGEEGCLYIMSPAEFCLSLIPDDSGTE